MSVKKIKILSKSILVASIIIEIFINILINFGYRNKIYFIISGLIIPIFIILSLIGIIYVEFKKSSFKTLKIIYYISTSIWIFYIYYMVYYDTIGFGHFVSTFLSISIISLFLLTILNIYKNGFNNVRKLKIEWLLFILCIISVIGIYMWK